MLHRHSHPDSGTLTEPLLHSQQDDLRNDSANVEDGLLQQSCPEQERLLLRPSGAAPAAKPALEPAGRHSVAEGATEPAGASDAGECESLEEALAKADAASSKAVRRQLLGLLLYAVSTIFGTGMSLSAKLAGHRGIGVFEVVLFRSLFLVAVTGPELAWRKVNPFGDKIRRWLYLLRGVLGYCSVSSLYMAVSLLPMGDAAVLSFLSPVFVASMSPLVLRERPSKGLLLAIPFCMAGVLLVSKPSFIFGHGAAGAISALGVSVGILQAVFNAAARMAVRALSIGSSEPMAAILFSMGSVSAVCAAITLGALRVFAVPHGWQDWSILLSAGVFGYLYQVTLTAGLQRADAAPAVAMSYLGVIWGIAADVVIFSTPPTALSLAGAAIISASSFLVAYGERRRQQQAKAALRWEASQQRLAREGAGSCASLAGLGGAGRPGSWAGRGSGRGSPDLVLPLLPPTPGTSEDSWSGVAGQGKGKGSWASWKAWAGFGAGSESSQTLEAGPGFPSQLAGVAVEVGDEEEEWVSTPTGHEPLPVAGAASASVGGEERSPQGSVGGSSPKAGEPQAAEERKG